MLKIGRRCPRGVFLGRSLFRIQRFGHSADGQVYKDLIVGVPKEIYAGAF